MKTLIVAAAASLLPFATPALAQRGDAYLSIHRHHHATHHVRADRESSRYGSGDVYVREGRASAPDIPVPAFAWRPEAEQEGVGADLVGPGSSAENPTGQYDVSR